MITITILPSLIMAMTITCKCYEGIQWHNIRRLQDKVQGSALPLQARALHIEGCLSMFRPPGGCSVVVKMFKTIIISEEYPRVIKC